MLKERTEVDQIEVVGPHRRIAAREVTIVERNGVEVARTHRYVSLDPDASIAGKPKIVQAAAKHRWTAAVKRAWGKVKAEQERQHRENREQAGDTTRTG